MIGRLVKGGLLVIGISALHGPLSSFHLNAVQPHGCGALVPQLKTPPRPISNIALVFAVRLGSGLPGPNCSVGPEMRIPFGELRGVSCELRVAPRLTPAKPAAMAAEP